MSGLLAERAVTYLRQLDNQNGGILLFIWADILLPLLPVSSNVDNCHGRAIVF